jgi:hypothetical protein
MKLFASQNTLIVVMGGTPLERILSVDRHGVKGKAQRGQNLRLCGQAPFSLAVLCMPARPRL